MQPPVRIVDQAAEGLDGRGSGVPKSIAGRVGRNAIETSDPN
jgi:hypothetical protein